MFKTLFILLKNVIKLWNFEILLRVYKKYNTFKKLFLDILFFLIFPDLKLEPNNLVLYFLLSIISNIIKTSFP